MSELDSLIVRIRIQYTQTEAQTAVKAFILVQIADMADRYKANESAVEALNVLAEKVRGL